MATTTAIGANPTRKNGAITVLQGGNVDANRVAENIALTSNSVQKNSNGNIYIASTTGNAKMYSGRAYGVVEASNYVIMTTPFNIAGVADTTLQKSSTFRNTEVNLVETVKISSLTDLAWDASGNQLPVYAFTRTNSTVTMGTDRAAHGSTSRRLTYMQGKANPTSEAF